MRKRWLKNLLIAASPIIAIAVFLFVERLRGQISVAIYNRELAAKGEKLSFKELVPFVPTNGNGAPAVYDAIERLRKRRKSEMSIGRIW